MERPSFKKDQANCKLVDLNKEAKKLLSLVKETAIQMESELCQSEHVTVQELHFGRVYAGMYKDSLMLFSNFEFEQYLTAYAGLAEVVLLSNPCPVLLARVAKAFVMAFVSMSDLTLDSEDWGDVLLNKTTAEKLFAVIDCETMM